MAVAFLVSSALLASPAAGQESRGVRELGFQVIYARSDPPAGTVGIAAAIRPVGPVRLEATAGGGVSDGESVGRGELLVHFLLNPTRTRGAGLYAGAGLAGVIGPVDEGYLVAFAGVEGQPGGRSGWFVEAGIGGGLRVAGGWRWRVVMGGKG